MCTPLQPAKAGAKLTTSRLPLGKLLDVQDTNKLLELNNTASRKVKLVEGAIMSCHLKPVQFAIVAINLVWE